MLYSRHGKYYVGLSRHDLLRKLGVGLLLSPSGVPFNPEVPPLLIAEPVKLLEQCLPHSQATALAHGRKRVGRTQQAKGPRGDPVASSGPRLRRAPPYTKAPY